MAFTKPSCLYVFMLVVTIIVYIGMLVVQSLIMSDGLTDLSRDVRPTVTYEDEDDFEAANSEFGPASWAFSIWFVIFTWQAVFLIYCVLSCFERFDLYRVPIACLPFYNLANLGGVGWTVLSERFDWKWPDLGCIALMPVSLYICFIISINSLHKRQCNYWLYTYCVHNAWAVFAGWVTVAVLLWLENCLLYAEPGPQMGPTPVATIMLGVLMIELVIFCTFELSIWDKFMRHIWAHYISLIVAITGSIIKHWNPEDRNSIMTVAIAGFVACSFLVKLVKIMYCERPDKVTQESSDVEKKYMEGNENGGLEHEEKEVPEITVTPDTLGTEVKQAL